MSLDHALRGRTRYPGSVNQKLGTRYLEGLNKTRTTLSTWSSMTQQIIVRAPTLLMAVYWDLRLGTYQLSINGTNYGAAHVLEAESLEEKFDLFSDHIILTTGAIHSIKMARTASTTWHDNDAPGSFEGDFWVDTNTLYNTSFYPQFCAPIKIDGIVYW